MKINKRLEVYSGQTGTLELIATAIFDKDKNEIVWLTGGKALHKNLMSSWTRDERTGEKVYPNEPEKFFEALGTMCGWSLSAKFVEQ